MSRQGFVEIRVAFLVLCGLTALLHVILKFELDFQNDVARYIQEHQPVLAIEDGPFSPSGKYLTKSFGVWFPQRPVYRTPVLGGLRHAPQALHEASEHQLPSKENNSAEKANKKRSSLRSTSRESAMRGT